MFNGQTDLLVNPLLQTLSLAINTTLSLFMCLVCGTGFTHTAIGLHLTRAHGICTEASEKKELQELAIQAEIASSYPVIEPTREPRLPFSGLIIHKGFGCPHCPKIGTSKNIFQHLKAAHPEASNLPPEEVQTQVINGGATKTHFRVKPITFNTITTTSSTTNSLLSEAIGFKWQSISPSELPNPRQVSPWLMRTGWYKFTEGHDVEALCKLVSYSKDSEHSGLQALLTLYFDKANQLLDETDELVLQRLNTCDPSKR